MEVSWDSLHAQIAACQQCELCRQIHNKVPGQGDGSADLMFIGEGPGADEDLQGLAFVGAAGQLLTKMIAAIGYTREQVYICNVVKCRPPHNRTPEPQEAAACLPFLRAQFSLVRPRVIVLLGATAARAVLGDQIRITRDRGQWVEKKGVWFMPTYHPAALLRDVSKKRDAWHDLQMVQAKLKELQGPPASPNQQGGAS
ncbi:MAG: uracil-DNA glycosylase [Clostridia bacterium]|nr:uracil-DNA glycosylase [Clostridia bacterium]